MHTFYFRKGTISSELHNTSFIDTQDTKRINKQQHTSLFSIKEAKYLITLGWFNCWKKKTKGIKFVHKKVHLSNFRQRWTLFSDWVKEHSKPKGVKWYVPREILNSEFMSSKWPFSCILRSSFMLLHYSLKATNLDQSVVWILWYCEQAVGSQ